MGNFILTKSATRIAFLYALFAGIALAANLGAQVVTVSLYSGPWAIEASVIIGTLVGLPIKYVLDKKFIFQFKAANLRHDSRLFVLYSAMAIVTTVVFWGMEGAFQLTFGTETMRLVGGALGLIIGYIIKYQLDKKYVFRTAKEEE